MDFNTLGSSVHGILQTRILEWVSLLQRIFLTQRLNPSLLHCRQLLYQLCHQGSSLYHNLLPKIKNKRLI